MARSTIALIEAIGREIWDEDGWLSGAAIYLAIGRRNLQRWRDGSHEPKPESDRDIRAKLPSMARTGALDLAAESNNLSRRVAKLGALCAELQEEALAQD